MIASQYQREAIRTDLTSEKYAEILLNLTEADIRMFHMSMGMCTETGELHDELKRCIVYGKEFDRTHVIEELGDLMWYIANMCNIIDIPLEAVMQINNSKLRARYPDKFDSELALNRNLEKEREVLENGQDI